MKQQEEVLFVDEELTCPLCDSYRVEESELRNSCQQCGTTWGKGKRE